MTTTLLTAVYKQFNYYKLLGTRTFAQLSDEELFYKPDPACNSIAMVVKHMAGNMRSRFTEFLVSDGEKEWRNRDSEFYDDLHSRSEVVDLWNAGWDLVLETVDQLHIDQLDDIVYIRNIGHTVAEALLRQLAHYAYHTGQIVQLGTMQRGSRWQSLSIPKGESDAYNRAAFAKQPRRGHYTDEFTSDSPDDTQ